MAGTMIEADGLRELTLLLNDRCSLRCDYCGFHGGDQACGELDRGSVERAIRLFFTQPAAPSRVLCLDADGEVMLSRPLLERALLLAASLRARGEGPPPILALCTNATLVDREFATFLAELGVSVTISLDGAARAHDLHRRDAAGQGSHALVMKGIGHLHRASVPMAFRAVVTPGTVALLEESWVFLAALPSARPLKLRPARPKGKALLDPSWMGLYTEGYLRLVGMLLDHGVPLDVWPDDARAMALYLGSNREREAPCGAGRSMLWLRPDGRLLPCGLLDPERGTIGLIEEVADPQSLARIACGHRARALVPRPEERAPCASCRWRPACRGGCPILAAELPEPPCCALTRGLGELLTRRSDEVSSLVRGASGPPGG